MKTKTSNRKKNLSIWFVALSSLLLVASHNFFPQQKPIITKQSKKYSSELKNRKELSYKLSSFYEKGGDLNSDEFKSLFDSYIFYRESANKEYKELKKLRRENKIFGFDSMNNFLFQSSVFFVTLIVALLFNLLVFQVEFQSLRRCYTFASISFLTISFYYLGWSFYHKSDLPYYLHVACIAIVSLVSSLAVNRVIKWLYDRNALLEIHKYNFRRLWRFIINEVPAKHIPESNMDDYVNDYVKEIDAFKIADLEK